MLIQPSTESRKAFTLVELLVAIGIAIVLAGLAALTFPNFRQSTAVSNSVNQLQATLSVAKQRAIRDKLPRGVRLINTGDPFVTELQFIELPEPIVPPVGSRLVLPSGGATYAWTARIIFPSAGHALDVFSLISLNDYLEIADFGGFVGQIMSAPALSGAEIQFQIRGLLRAREGAGPAGLTVTEGFRILRAPKPMLGEPNVQMNRAGVRLDRCQGLSPNSENHYDVIFGPNGEVAHATTGRMIFWVAPLTGNAQPSLLCLYTKSGYMAVYDIAPGADPTRSLGMVVARATKPGSKAEKGFFFGEICFLVFPLGRGIIGKVPQWVGREL